MLERCFRLSSVDSEPGPIRTNNSVFPALVAHAMFRKKSTGPVNRQHQVEIVWSEHARDMTRADGFANSSDGISFYWHIVMKTGISGGIGETVNGSCRLRILLCSRHPQAARDIPRRLACRWPGPQHPSQKGDYGISFCFVRNVSGQNKPSEGRNRVCACPRRHFHNRNREVIVERQTIGGRRLPCSPGWLR